MSTIQPGSLKPEPPRGNASGFLKYFRYDVLAGLMVFIIALPLCLAISLASGYPPMAGIFTAVIGSIVATLISNSELTIKGPAAGLIVIAIGCVADFGGDGFGNGASDADFLAYRSALAVGVVASVLQILFSLFRAGILSEFFPKSAIHGMLSAIGVIIIAKQIPNALGVSTSTQEPLELLMEIPHLIAQANPAIAFIGLISLLLLISWPYIKKQWKALTVIPPQLIVLVMAVLIGLYLNLSQKEHAYNWFGQQYNLSDSFLVPLPQEMFGLFTQITTPRLEALQELKAWKWVFMFFIIGTLESILSAKAIDSIDPWKRKTDMNRDVLAVGIANLLTSCVGGLPMISEIVRSKANIDNGARTRFADLWHGIFLLLCVALLPATLHMIPKAALAAMLIYTGFRLAHPSEFMHMFQVGREQLIIFVTTLLVTLATDLLIGVAAGIAMKFFIHLLNGVPLKSFFKAYLDVEQISENTCRIHASESAVFSNWIPFKRQIEHIGLVQRNNIIVDVSDAKLIDHTVMEKLHEMQQDMAEEGLRLDIVGLELHQALSDHGDAARKRGMARMRRITIVADAKLTALLQRECIRFGATGFTLIESSGVGRHNVSQGLIEVVSNVRMEVIVPFSVCETILKFLKVNVVNQHHATVTVETVEVLLAQQFTSEDSNSLLPAVETHGTHA